MNQTWSSQRLRWSSEEVTFNCGSFSWPNSGLISPDIAFVQSRSHWINKTLTLWNESVRFPHLIRQNLHLHYVDKEVRKRDCLCQCLCKRSNFYVELVRGLISCSVIPAALFQKCSGRVVGSGYEPFHKRKIHPCHSLKVQDYCLNPIS